MKRLSASSDTVQSVRLARFVCIGVWLVAAFSGRTSAEQPTPHGLLRIQIAAGEKSLRLQLDAGASLTSKTGSAPLAAGAYTVRVENAKAAQQRFHLIAKTFQMTEKDAARAYVQEWKGRGFDPQALVFGRRYEVDGGAPLDNQAYWISMARVATEQEARQLKKKLEAMSVWAWIQPETIAPGSGTILFLNDKGKTLLKAAAPFEMKSERPILVKGVDVGYQKVERKDRAYGGSIEVRVGPDAGIDLVETVRVEEYLAGVLPGEMPAGWPAEALKAQAVAARSDVAAAASGKHMLEGFDFCGTEHCRVYLGKGGRRETTDTAVRATVGIVLALDGKVAPAVFSSNCGGWTEDNDTVWSAPASQALRGAPDLRGERETVEAFGISKWLKTPPPAYCSGSKDHFRWRKRYTTRELDTLVNRSYAVGNVRSIEPGDRGPSGRLKSVKIVGSKTSEIVRKDLSIRQAFGGLNSSAFVVEVEGSASHPTAFAFVGAGRGHGVGLCQQGAHGRALAGQDYRAILNAYFGHAQLVKVQ